ncbi:MAG TPA: hypothetical protein VHY56_01670 [Candidatus Binataceae bacterium]|jgi:hypothetical protein|nr:hypothetical protein [Candidatus Binataceae bacterium]
MTPGESIKLDRLQRDALAPQLDAFLAATPDSPSREPFAALRAVLDSLEVPEELAARLGAITELALTSGRVRAAHGPGAELALWSLFQKTPKGREITASIEALNRALAQLQGQTLEHLGAVARAPGAYALTLKTAGCQLVIRFEPAGIRVETVEFG